MSIHPQTIQNNMLASLSSQAGAKVAGSIQRASASTGVDFAYLMQQANAESSFRPDAKASTSSATGLFQFIDKTWMSMINRYGEQYGIDTSQPKQDLLNLRNDPEISSQMAGELAKENKQVMQSLLGQDADIGSTELYFAHFMGPSRAAGFLQAHQENPYMKGSDLFPKEAQTNKGVFFDGQGQSRTLSEIYSKFDKKFSVESSPVAPSYITPAETQIASAPTYTSKSVSSPTKDYTPQYLPSNPLGSMQRMNPMLDLLSPAMPMIRSESSAISSFSYFMKAQYGTGNLLQSPTDIALLAALEDSFGS